MTGAASPPTAVDAATSGPTADAPEPRRARPTTFGTAVRRWVRSGSTWELVAVVAFTLWIAWPFLAPGGYVTDYDTITYSGPNLVATFRAWGEHRLPLWEPGIFGGTSFAGNLQTAIFYPLKVVFWPLGAPAAMGAMTATHLFLLAFGMRRLARRTLRLAPPAGLAAAVVMVGSGTTMVRSVRFEQIAVVAWIPWLLVAIDAIVAAPSGRRVRPVAAGAAATAMVLLSGHPNQALIGVALAGVWTVVRVRDRRPAGARAAFTRVAASTGLGLGIATLPVVLAVPLFRRIGVSPDVMLQEASSDRYVLLPSRIVSAFLGDALSSSRPSDFPTLETPVFVGVGALLLAVVGAVVWCSGTGERRNRATAWGLVTAALVSVVVALGPSFGVYRLAAAVVPGFGSGRVPVRWLFVTTFAVALLAAAGTSALVTSGLGHGRERRALLWAAGGAAAIVAVTSVAPPWGELAPTVGARVSWLVIVVVLAATAGIVRRRPDARSRLIAGSFAVAVVVVELGLPARASYARSVRTDHSFADQVSVIDTFLAEHGARALVVGRTSVNANLTVGWRTLDGYDGGLWLTDSYVAAAQRLSDRPFKPLERLGEQIRLPLNGDALARVGVRYVVIDPASAAAERSGRLARTDDVIAERERLVAGWSGPVVVDGSHEVWENPQFRGEAFVSRKESAATAPQDGAPLAMRRPEPGAIDVSTGPESSGGRLVVAEQALPGWTVTIDGQPAALVDVDGFALAGDVPAGAHEVRFRYEPPGFQVGAAASLLSIAVTAALGLVRRRSVGQRPMRRAASNSSGSTERSGMKTT